MSPDLFNLYLEHIMRVALSGASGMDFNDDDEAKVGGRRVNNLRFADDIALITKTLQQAQVLLGKVDYESARYGQEISQTKTEWMRARPKAKKTKEGLIKLKEEQLKQVEIFKYLGANISAFGDCMQDTRIRTATAFRSMANLSKTWKGR